MIFTFIYENRYSRIIGIIADNDPDIYWDNLGSRYLVAKLGNIEWRSPLIVTDARSRISRTYPRTRPAKSFQDKLGFPKTFPAFPVDSRAYARKRDFVISRKVYSRTFSSTPPFLLSPNVVRDTEI